MMPGSTDAGETERKNMKTILMTLGAVAVAAIAFNAVAADPVLSPRTATAQTKTVAGLNSDPNLVNTAGVTITPRAINRSAKVAGVSDEINPVAGCRNM